MTCELIGYRRVSTKEQGLSGLGLEGQQAAIDAHVAATGCRLIKTYTEVESGKRCDRPELAKALAHARRSGATLVIAKLDRLGRNAHFLTGLMEGDVKFVCCDNPYTNDLTVGILAVIAQEEARAISERTKAALVAYRENKRVSKRVTAMYQGNVPANVVEATAGKLGAALTGSNLDEQAKAKGRAMGNAAQLEKAKEVYADLIPEMKAAKEQGQTLQAIADRLNSDGHTTRNSAAWSPVQVLRTLKRAGV